MRSDIETKDRREMEDKVVSDSRERNDEMTRDRRTKADHTVVEHRSRNDEITANRREVSDGHPNRALAIFLLVLTLVVAGTLVIFA